MNVCTYIIEVCYRGKNPYFIFSPSFTVARKAGFLEMERAAIAASIPEIRKWTADHYPDGTLPPEIIKAKLGSMVFVPEFPS